MIKHEEADRVYNLFADLEASYLDLICLVGTDTSVNKTASDGPLHLMWQHMVMLNQQLYALLTQLTDEERQPELSMGGNSLDGPMSLVNTKE